MDMSRLASNLIASNDFSHYDARRLITERICARTAAPGGFFFVKVTNAAG
jgi:hypothetical protein